MFPRACECISTSPPGKQDGIIAKEMPSAARWAEFKSSLVVYELEGETLHLSLWFEHLNLPFYKVDLHLKQPCGLGQNT